MLYIYKILRITAWLLVIATLLILFSGFLTTKFFLAPWLGYSASYYIHTIIAPLIFLPLFYFHSLAGLLIMISRNCSLNKIFIKILVAVLWTGVFVLFIFLYEAKNPAVQINNNVGSPNGLLNTALPQTIGSQNILLNLDEIKKHNQISDCWMIINGKVYNLTSYFGAHPGGAGTMLPYCGGDGTNAFLGKPHSGYASSLLNSYYIGNVGGTLDVQTIQNTNSAPAGNRSGGNEEYDD